MIQVSKPFIGAKEIRYVNAALEEGWISSTGRFIDEFEEKFARWLGVTYAVTCSSGTTALHLALLALGVGPGDEVIVPSLSFVATINAVIYTGATPILADVDPTTWGLSPDKVKRALTRRTKAVIVVHLYGLPADSRGLQDLIGPLGIHLVEDAAEGLGGWDGDAPVGTLGHIAIFSFYGNKVMSTGEGGMLVTGDADLANLARRYRGQGQDPHKRYFHDLVGYNYRLTNLQCALGVAQLERLDDELKKRADIFTWYTNLIRQAGLPVEIPIPRLGCIQAPWLFTILLDETNARRRDNLQSELAKLAIETRPSFFIAQDMPPYVNYPRRPANHPHAASLSKRGLSLPTHTSLVREDVERVVAGLASTLK